MSIGSAGRARGATARGGTRWRGEPYFRCDQRKTGS
jgi:hypothetical protein